MARKFKKGDTIRGKISSIDILVVEDQRDDGRVLVRYPNRGYNSLGLVDDYTLVKKRPSKKDRRIAELTDQLADKTKQANEHAEDAIKRERESVAAQYAEDQRLLTAGLVRIDFLRNIMERGLTHSDTNGVRHHFLIAERSGRGNGALLSAFLKELKK